MKKEMPRLIIIFLVVIGLVFWMWNYLFLSGKTAIKSRATDESILSLSFNPNASTLSTGQEMETTLKIKPTVEGGILVRGYLVSLFFDKTKLQLKNIEYKIGGASPDLGATNSSLSTINGNGVIRLVGEVTTPTGTAVAKDVDTELVKLKFSSVNGQGATIQIGRADAKFYILKAEAVLSDGMSIDGAKIDFNGGGAIITPGITGAPNPTTTGGTSGNVNLNLKLKFQGISGKPADSQNSMAVKVKLKKEGETNPSEATGVFSADTSGVWSGKASFNLSSVSGKYLIYIKGPQHIQKKFCDSAPSENNAGTYSCANANISITVGDNNLDFSKVMVLSGDLDQNGVVDSVDISIVRNNLGKTDTATLTKADVNRDGRVDTQDFSLILAALAVRTDEL
ncbi:hypothetical protein CO006_00410 [Candidatus Roizmanbacteria bacterium CG_4_8_14_3_um_filter_35_14]|uniref:Dockerin domain-containing protein n=1 Tax=Candidatus Roizmanbacteria bacterium CG10_big_fil_rev_8_21_14_0_10_36_26 TaxID=1974851 RepID=A0A2M8KLX5_9BACT|nr:MAG: hypothetical protein CO006_00410 [Candidatus Roizmanbacteria bacterium CG_4_8_14_3_um_filter_35_14]PJE60927.1 MAG: hypothetical protein COU86_01705 [Candidatus Roizmanbacteria bacterium CG10_big_fil_rev_8_21_14_0_10_36_26]